jgi:hypothetical protein
MQNNNEIALQQSAELQLKVELFAGEIQLVIPDTPQETWDEVVRLEEQAFINTAKRGMLLMTLREAVGHGKFKRELKERGIGTSSAFNALTVAKMLISLPNSKVQTLGLLNFNKTQLVEIARLPLQTLESLDDKDLDNLSDLSVRELKKELKRLTNEKQESDINAADAINELERERIRKKPNERFDLPVFIAQCRSDAIAYTEMMDDALSQSVAQTTQLIERRELDFDSRLAAAQTMHHCWASMYMQIGSMLERLHGEFGDRMQGIENLPRFDKAEWEYVDSERGRMLESFQAFHNAKKGAN